MATPAHCAPGTGDEAGTVEPPAPRPRQIAWCALGGELATVPVCVAYSKTFNLTRMQYSSVPPRAKRYA